MDKKFVPYDFRNRDFSVDCRLYPTLNAEKGAGCAVTDDWEIIIPSTYSRLVKYYSGDLFSFFRDAFGICLRVRFVEDHIRELKNPDRKIFLLTEEHQSDIRISSDQLAAFYLDVTENSILIVGKSERGTAQGVYYLEDRMRLRGEATVPLEKTEHAPLFSPRMTHCGYELDTFSDAFLAATAHAGMDAIIVFTGHPDMNIHGFEDPDALWPGTGRGYCDFNNLIWRAEGFGLDVYIYSQIKCDMHPAEEGAVAYYENSFGTFFKKCPKIKGIILVGETFEFPSKDPHTCGIRHQLKPKTDPRPSPGWYPCYDYPDLLKMVKKIIHAHSPSAEIVFWSYNWGWAEKDARLALIKALPRDITLLVTFEMWEYLKDSHGGSYKIADYSISFPGPAQVFIDEAEMAKQCGIRLYSMSNTGGRTWDIGSAPYLPVPQQWIKRYEALSLAKEKYGLCGLMENHHYGWMPSFLDLLAKNAFTTNSISDGELLEAIAKRDWGNCYREVMGAWSLFSEGISHVIACSLDQYGPYRCGPSYPLTFTQTKKDLSFPSAPWAWQKGFGIWNPIYADPVFPNVDNSLMRLRHVETVTDCFRRGVEILKRIFANDTSKTSNNCKEQVAVAEYIYCCYVTATNVMRWNIAKQLLLVPVDDRGQNDVVKLLNALSIPSYDRKLLAEYMNTVALQETQNVAQALECQQVDSRLGFEASMEYVFDPDTAAWKNKVTQESLLLLKQYCLDLYQ